MNLDMRATISPDLQRSLDNELKRCPPDMSDAHVLQCCRRIYTRQGEHAFDLAFPVDEMLLRVARVLD